MLEYIIKGLSEHAIFRTTSDVVLTVNIGSYDDLLEPNNPSDKIVYVCITDSCPKSSSDSVWNIVRLDKPEGITNRSFAKIFKCHFLKLFPNAPRVLWADSSVYLKDQHFELFELFGNRSGLFFLHPGRKFVADELGYLIKNGLVKDDVESKVEAVYKERGRDLKSPLIAGTLFILKNSNEMKRVMSEWYTLVQNVCIRDQLTLPLALEKVEKEALLFLDDYANNKYFSVRPHRKFSFPESPRGIRKTLYVIRRYIFGKLQGT